MEPLSIGAALASANHLKGLLTGLAQAIKAAGKAEVTNQFIDLQIAMGDVLQRVRDLEDDNRRLRDEADLRSKLKYASPIYVLEGCGNADGRYCQVCRDKEGKLARVNLIQRDDCAFWDCAVCGNRFEVGRVSKAFSARSI